MASASQARRNARAQQQGFANDYQRRKALGQGRGFHPSEFRRALASTKAPVASVVTDLQRNAAGQIVGATVVTTDINGKQRVWHRKVRKESDLTAIADAAQAAGVPVLQGYEGTATRGRPRKRPKAGNGRRRK